jgi:hypothetical protein
MLLRLLPLLDEWNMAAAMLFDNVTPHNPTNQRLMAK